jgi:signal transduction histidine kinase
MTAGFVILLAAFGWLLTRSIAHSAQLQSHFNLIEQQHHIRLALTTFMWVLFPAVALGAWIIIGRTLNPLRSLSRQADKSTSTRLVAPSSDQEMVELVSTINGLLDRIETTAEAKTQFYAAASHELRTPLQALSGHIDTALSKERPEGEYREALVEAQKQTQRLVSLTRDILTLHQLQAQHIGDDEHADVVKSVSIVLDELEPLTEARRLSIDAIMPAEMILRGRQTYSDICVRNLVENAVRYSVHATRVTVRLTSTELEIVNNVSSAKQVDLQKVMEPFESSSGGNGLGIAICRAAAEANGWSLDFYQIDDQFAVIIRF